MDNTFQKIARILRFRKKSLQKATFSLLYACSPRIILFAGIESAHFTSPRSNQACTCLQIFEHKS